MLISVLFAWAAALCALLTTVKFLAKRNKKLNKFFHRIHIPCGIIMIAAGLIHGLWAGNSPGSSLGDAMVAPLLFSFNMGTVCFVLSVLLAVTYLLRKKLKKAWMLLHRVLTGLLAASLIIHLCQVGISLPTFFAGSSDGTAGLAITEVTETPVAAESITEASANATPLPASETEIPADTAAPSAPVTEAPEDAAVQPETKQPAVTFSGAVLKDGTYEGSANGFKGTVKLSVLVSDGAVTAINVLQQSDTPQFWERASTLITTIIAQQSLEVDAVSGATFSSKGIQNAVYQALQEAVTEGELQITEITTSNNSHGGPGRH